jgi:hypothetical protein
MVTMQMPLLNEGTDVWRPVKVTPLEGAVYRVEGPQADDEEWEFEPGTLIEVKWRTFSNGEVMLVPAGPVTTVGSIFSDHYKRSAGMVMGVAPVFVLMGKLPRSSDGTPERLPLLLACAGLSVLVIGCFFWLKPRSLVAKWGLYSALASAVLMSILTFTN